MIISNYLNLHENIPTNEDLVKFTTPGDARSLSRTGLLLAFVLHEILDELKLKISNESFKYGIYSIQESGPINLDVASKTYLLDSSIDIEFKKYCEPKQHLKTTSIVSLAHLGKLTNCLGPLYIFNSSQLSIIQLLNQIQIDFENKNIEYFLICSVLSREDYPHHNFLVEQNKIKLEQELANCIFGNFDGFITLKKLISEESQSQKNNIILLNSISQKIKGN